MATISSAGIGSGLNLETLIEDLVTAERSASTTTLDRQQADIDLKLNSYAALKGITEQFQASLALLKNSTTFQSVAATTADANIFTVGVDNTASIGSYGVEVTALAVADKRRSAYSESTTSTVGTGTLTVTSGSNSFALTIDSSNNSLAGLRDAINEASENTFVDATVLTGSEGSTLVLTSKNTGVSNAISLTGTGDLDGFADQFMDTNQVQSSTVAATSTTALNDSGTLDILIGGSTAQTDPDITINTTDTLEDIRDAINANSDVNTFVVASIVNTSGGKSLLLTNIDPTNSSETITVSGTASIASSFSTSSYVLDTAADASLKIDGEQATSSTNTFSDVVTGVDITVRKVSEADTETTLTVSKDTTTPKANIVSFVDSYNLFQTTISGLTKYDTLTEIGGVLIGDSLARSLTTQVRKVMSLSLDSTQATSIQQLSALGIETQRNGSLKIDDSTLSAAISSNLNDVATLFSGSGVGIADRLDTFLSEFVQTNGIFDQKQESLQASTQRINAQRDNLELRITKLEERLRSSFINMDLIVGNLKSQQTFISQQFDNLPGFAKSSGSS